MSYFLSACNPQKNLREPLAASAHQIWKILKPFWPKTKRSDSRCFFRLKLFFFVKLWTWFGVPAHHSSTNLDRPFSPTFWGIVVGGLYPWGTNSNGNVYCLWLLLRDKFSPLTFRWPISDFGAYKTGQCLFVWGMSRTPIPFTVVFPLIWMDSGSGTPLFYLNPSGMMFFNFRWQPCFVHLIQVDTWFPVYGGNGRSQEAEKSPA